MQTGTDRYSEGAAIAQWVERPTEKPGAVLTRVRVPGAAREFFFPFFFSFLFFPRVNFQCRLSYGVRTASCVQSHASASVRTLKIPNTVSRTIVWTQDNTTHTDRNG